MNKIQVIPSVLPFKQRYHLEKLKELTSIAVKDHPDCVLIVIEKAPGFSPYPALTSNMFLTPKNKTILFLQEEIKKRLAKLVSKNFKNQPFFIFIDSRLMNKHQKIGTIYESYQNREDKIIYLQYTSLDPY